MKKLFTIISLFLLVGFAFAQQASDYFPSQTGFEWKFKAIPLDSASNPINALAYYRMDNFESIANYNGRLANIVQTKSGPLDSILFQPYQDSLFYNLDGTTGFEYFNIRNIKEILISLDDSGYVSNFSFLDFFTLLQDWYDTYRFAAPVNSEYLLLQIDTTVTVVLPPPVPVPIRFKYLGTRLQDEAIQTVLGNFDCKKFLLQWKISYFIFSQEYPLLTTNDTIWIAPDNWIVQDIIPGQYVQINIFGRQINQSLLGLDTRLTDEIVSVADERSVPGTFILEQNYPNPFNPSTKISYVIGHSSLITLKVYDILGNEIETLVNEEKTVGSYEVEFNATGLPSGIYFYQLRAGSFIETKKMILLK